MLWTKASKLKQKQTKKTAQFALLILLLADLLHYVTFIKTFCSVY